MTVGTDEEVYLYGTRASAKLNDVAIEATTSVTESTVFRKKVLTVIWIDDRDIELRGSRYHLDNNRNLAIVLLGEFRARGAMDALVYHLLPHRLLDGSVDNLGDAIDHELVAMIKIGHPALEYLEERMLTETNRIERVTIEWAILEMKRARDKGLW